MQLVLFVLTRGDEQDGRLALFPCGAAQREPVRARQHDVEQQQVELPGFDEPECGIAVRRGNDRERAAALCREVVGDDLAHRLFVLRQKNRCFHALPSLY